MVSSSRHRRDSSEEDERREKRRKKHRSRSPRGDRRSSPSDHKRKRHKKSRSKERTDSKKIRKEEFATETSAGGGGEQMSLSIEETNKIRASIGLAPLEVGDEGVRKNESGNDIVGDNDVWVPAQNAAQQLATEKLKEKMATLKEKRKFYKKLQDLKTLGDEDEADDLLAWIRKSRELDAEKKRADERARLMDEMDSQFGINNLVGDEFASSSHKKKGSLYSSRDLAGLKVEHSHGAFREGETVVLTLKDKAILDEDSMQDTLINVNAVDIEMAEKFKLNKKRLPGYNPYDDEFDEYGMPKMPEILGKYNEVIEGEGKKSFQLGEGGQADDEETQTRAWVSKRLAENKVSLEMIKPKLASDFINKEDSVTFNKIGKKRKIRKVRKKVRTRAEDLMPEVHEYIPGLDGGDHGSRRNGRRRHISDDEILEKFDVPGFEDNYKLEVDDDQEEDIEPTQDLSGVKIGDIEESMLGIHEKLNIAKTLIKKEPLTPSEAAKSVAEKLRLASEAKHKLSGHEEVSGIEFKSEMILDGTSEFCRSVGHSSTKPQGEDKLSKNNLDQELEEMYLKDPSSDEESGGKWDKVTGNVASDRASQPSTSSSGFVLEAEPELRSGVAGALQMASKKGYLEDPSTNKKVSTVRQLVSKILPEYAIEDKSAKQYEGGKKDDWERGSYREFKDMEGYKPTIKIEYVDEKGRFLNEKEAFRQLSHRFHGKGSGKMKTEKRSKKLAEDHKLLTMSSTDTPLHTVAMMQEKHKQLQSPFMVLSGGSGKALTASALDVKK